MNWNRVIWNEARTPARGGIVALAAALAVAASHSAPLRAQELPSKLTDSTFWKLITDFSEPGGYFRSDNFVSNEMAFQYVIPTLLKTTKPSGVYLGVGPDQNFTYIVALKPKLSFIFDIRRGNLQEHLLYKAAVEMAETRADFLSLLFSRPRPPGLDTAMTADALLNAYASVRSSDTLFQRNLKAVRDWLTKHHGFALGDSDLAGIEYVYSAFSAAGPDLTYNFGNARGGYGGFGRGMPTYGELMVLNDGTAARVQRSYIASEANFRALRDAELNNAIVPLVGNFAGDKAIRAVAKYLKERNATVTAFYLSNVEQYLWNGSDDGRKFFGNVGALPLDSASTFIRAVFGGGGYGRSFGGGGMRGPTILASMMEQLKAFTEGRISSYYDVIQLSR